MWAKTFPWNLGRRLFFHPVLLPFPVLYTCIVPVVVIMEPRHYKRYALFFLFMGPTQTTPTLTSTYQYHPSFIYAVNHTCIHFALCTFFLQEIAHQIWITLSSYESPKHSSNFGLWMKIHIGYLRLTFLLCVFWNVLSKGLLVMMHNRTGRICLAFLYCVF